MLNAATIQPHLQPTRTAASQLDARYRAAGSYDPRGGFAHAGEFFAAIIRAAMQGHAASDDRLLGVLASTPSTSANESSGTDGGFAVPVAFAQEVFTHALAEDALLPFCDVLPIKTNSMFCPTDETTPWGTDGVQGYWITEGLPLTASKPKVRETLLRMSKYAVLVPLSDEILEDSGALNAYLPRRAGDRIRWAINDAILFGTGAGTPLGCLTGAGTAGSPSIVVAKESGQASNTIAVQNLAKMYARLPQGSHNRAVWLFQPDTLALGLSLGAQTFPMTAPSPNYPGSCGTLFGRPAFASQHCAALSAQGDVLLVDLSYVTAIVKAPNEVQTILSLHVAFDADVGMFRVIMRLDAQPKIMSPLASAHGGSTLSPFVALGAR